MGIDWKGVRQDYLCGGITIKALADKYGCHPDTIRRRARTEKWRDKEREAPSKNAPIFLPMEQNKTPGITMEHRDLWKGVRRRLVKGLKSPDLKQGLEELKVAKVAGEVLSSVIKGERLAWGLKDDESEKTQDDKEITGAMASLTVPQGADEAVDGE